VPGTDSFAGFTLHRELELHAQAGIPISDVLHNATLGCARVMKRDKVTGSIAVGKEADIILVDGDPGARIEDIRKVSLVVRGGRIHLPADIYPAMGIRP
jgi:imidazolonepropionase-like amidohydrolase